MRILNPNETATFVQTSGDVKEAIERTREAEAYQREALVRKFGGDKLAAEQYARAKALKRGERV